MLLERPPANPTPVPASALRGLWPGWTRKRKD